MIATPLPTAEDINVHDSLDERHACRVFFGKSIAEAEALFRENALFYSEDLLWMGPVGFQFYLAAYINYLLSPASAGDSDGINCFTGLLEFRTQQDSAALIPIQEVVTKACHKLVKDFAKFEANPDFYGPLSSRLELVAKRISTA